MIDSARRTASSGTAPARRASMCDGRQDRRPRHPRASRRHGPTMAGAQRRHGPSRPSRASIPAAIPGLRGRPQHARTSACGCQRLRKLRERSRVRSPCDATYHRRMREARRKAESRRPTHDPDQGRAARRALQKPTGSACAPARPTRASTRSRRSCASTSCTRCARKPPARTSPSASARAPRPS